MPNEILIASDHAGYELKEQLKVYLKLLGCEYIDLGTNSKDSVDYPDFAEKLASKISDCEYERGILVCGTGVGMSIVANRFPGVRAALCCTEVMADLSRRHNDSNVLVLGARVLEDGLAQKILDSWLGAEFEGGRHKNRLDKVASIERKLYKGRES